MSLCVASVSWYFRLSSELNFVIRCLSATLIQPCFVLDLNLRIFVDPACILWTTTACDLASTFVISYLTMVHCFKCASEIDENGQYYRTSDMGPDIISVIEQNLGYEVTNNETVCWQCFANFMEAMPASDANQRVDELFEAPVVISNPNISSPLGSEEHELHFAHDTNVCVWCRSSLYGRRTHSLPEGLERSLISERILPRQIPDGGLVCYNCWVEAQRIIQQQGIVNAPPANSNRRILHCLECALEINEDGQYYMTGDMGPDIISVIEQNVGYEVHNNEPLCGQCFTNILEALPNSEPSQRNVSSPLGREEYELQLPHDPNVCVWCRRSIIGRRTHSLPEGAERNLISERISPREIPNGGLVCYACWVDAQRILQRQGIINAPLVDLNRCVMCVRSLARTRRHSIPNGSERNEIIARIYPREIPPGGRVCYACWVSVRRNVQRAQIIDQGRENPDPFPSHSHHGVVCVWCRTSLFRRHTHNLSSGPEREEVAARIYPRVLPEHALVCSNCWARAQENVIIEEGNVQIEDPSPSNTMSLDDFTHTTSSSNRCFVPNCTNNERNRVPDYLKKRILKSQKVFIAENARVCDIHKSVYNWDFLEQHQFSNTFTKPEMQSMLRLSVQEERTQFDFKDIESMDDSFFKFWTGVTKENYSLMLNQITPALNSKNPKTALGAYLIKARTGDSHERLATLLCKSKASVTRLLQAAREALSRLFVPEHLGINHITRQNIINRNLIIPEGLFGNTEERVPIVIADGSYIYLQKSSNYLFQKKTYSLHKYRNLVKPFLLVATDGHIIDIFGPYAATESDADIMKALFQNEDGDMRSFFRENDVFILDRGFRDAIPLLESLGYQIKKPESLQAGETQLPTRRANKSRCVTLCRWVVEVVNGRFKRDFKLFRQEYFNVAATHLMEDLRICAAILNAFHPEIVDRPDAVIILYRALERLDMPNILADLILTNRINRYRAQFTSIDAQLPELSIFPEMAMHDLIIFGLGIYQIKQARSYYGEHTREHGTFRVEVADTLEVVNQATPSHLNTILIRGRIKSRHQSARVYYTYILLARQGISWDERIISYYCSCISGQRTVGCCAHTMTMVWYLGWARYQDNIEGPASFLDDILVRDDVENENE